MITDEQRVELARALTGEGEASVAAVVLDCDDPDCDLCDVLYDMMCGE